MPYGWVAAATVAAGYMASEAQSDAADSSANAQKDAASQQISEQRRQFNQIQELLSPFVKDGTGAFEQQGVLSGLQGYDAQQKAISDLERSPLYQNMVKQGESGILQNASATGGLRGGNVQSALAQFRPQMLSGLISDQYNRLSGLSSMGLNAATGTGTFGQNSTNAISQALEQQGAATAGNYLAQGNAKAGMWGSVGQAAGIMGGYAGGGGGGMNWGGGGGGGGNMSTAGNPQGNGYFGGIR